MHVHIRYSRFILLCFLLGSALFVSHPKQTLESAEAAIMPRVMMYHAISVETYGSHPYLFVRPDDLREQLSALQTAGVRFLFADGYAEQAEASVILTFDDGYADNYTALLPLLKEYDACATVFLVTDTIGRQGHLNSAEIREMAASGRIQFGLHTASHADLTALTDAEIHAEMQKSMTAFIEAVGYAPSVMSYPYGRVDDRVEKICSEYVPFAYTTDYPPHCMSFGQMRIPRYTVARETTRAEFLAMAGIEK